MFKNERIWIKPLQNGYHVEYTYRQVTNPDATDKYDRYDSIEEEYSFFTWDEVVGFIQSHKLETPPVKL